MRKFRWASTLIGLCCCFQLTYGQDFSNKGKDFWVGYGYHERMTSGGGGSQTMVLYFATEAATTVVVEIPGTGYSQTYNIPANTIYTSSPIPKTGTQDARLNVEGVSNRGIHITATRPIVAYAHIYNMSVSGATLLFPTSTLGKDYYSINYEQISNTNNANCWFYAIAVDPGITTVEITPSQNTLTRPAGVPFTVNLQQGQVINIMGALAGQSGDIYRGADLTGSRIRSISSGTEGCKRLAVFSGSGRIALVCDGIGNGQKSSDNYMVQAFPKTAWGKTYLTVPTEILENNVFRIAVDDPTTIVRVNGIIQSGLRDNFFYEVGPLSAPAKIEADKPVMVAQYISTGRFCGNIRSGDLGDPEVIYLSPVEQTINKVILNSTPNFSISNHFINVTIPAGGTGISSFRLDGTPVTGFQPHPQNPAYAYARISVIQGQHVLESDSGFSAVAYGYGDFESYGYNAGANVKDLYQFVTVQNAYGSVDFPAACKDAPFALSMTFPYQPTSIEWRFNGLFPDVTDNAPVPSSTSVVNGRTLYKYTLPGNFNTATPGTYPIRVIAQNPTADGCNGVQEIDYDLEIFDKPQTSIDFSTNGCVSAPVSFTGTATQTNNRPIDAWYWSFGDGNTDQSGANVSHTYNAAGAYTVKYSVVTDIGCQSDTAVKTVQLTDPPTASFAVAGPYCAGQNVQFTDQSTAPSGASIVKWIWDFGDGTSPVTVNSNAAQTHSFASTGTFTVSLRVETAGGCLSTLFTRNITVTPNPTVDFSLPSVCLPAGQAIFNSLSTISDGTESSFVYSWNFGDGSPNAGGASPTHTYTQAGPFTVSLQVTSGNGCAASNSKTLTTIFEEPQAAFQAAAEVCLGGSLTLTDQSAATGATITQWNWDFGDGTSSTERNPVKTYAAAGIYTITLNVTTDKGCTTVGKFAQQQVQVLALPTADFTLLSAACQNKAVTIQDQSSSADGTIRTWQWNLGDNTSVVKDNNLAFSHVYSNLGDYTITLQVETDKGCKSVAHSEPVTVHPNPVASFEAPVVCINDVNAPFFDESTISSGTINNWEWNFGDPLATAANPNFSNLQNSIHHYQQPGSYTATLVAGSAAGCRDTTTRIFTVNGAVLTPSFTVLNGASVCSNEELKLKDASQVDAGSIIRVVILWDPSDPTAITTDDSPTPGKEYSHRYPAFSSPASRTYRVRYLVYSGISCVDSYEQDITVLASPQLALAAVAPVCSDATAVQFSTQGASTVPGSGVFSGPGINSTGLFNPATAGPGTHTIQYLFTANNGCTATADQTIVVNPTPMANAGPDKVVLEGGQVTLTPTLITDYPVSYLWTPATALNDPAQANAVASPTADIMYELTITSDQGCIGKDQVFVKILLAPVIPNIFSPNGDGVNDRWVIEHLESYPGCIVQLFNRYGQLVHRMVNYTTPWDGRINGRDAPVGTYYYVIDPRNGRKPMTGFVDIIR
ncbi:MAG: PKD domain-containing protein [Chitinophagaceae bacterium]